MPVVRVDVSVWTATGALHEVEMTWGLGKERQFRTVLLLSFSLGSLDGC